MALSGNKDVERKEGKLEPYLVENNVHIFQGAMVCANVDGYAVPAADMPGYVLLGVACEECDNILPGTNRRGAKSIRVYRDGAVKVIAPNATQATIGRMMYVKDDETVVQTSRYEVAAGVLVNYVDAPTGCWIDIATAIAV